MMTSPSAQLTRQLIELMSSARFEQALLMYSEDIVLKDVFGLPHAHEIHGLAELRNFYAPLLTNEGARMYEGLQVRNLVITETTDPDLAIAQWDYVSSTSDGEVVNANVIVVRTLKGKIVESIDYHNHITRAAASGALPGLLAELGAHYAPETQVQGLLEA
ncbi:nuclear transport factor 2 family protein [Arthrobacter sp. 31Y]|uniref:nuclear transport factor 2 family protein n=1 Tax=Arthrobacter sp. 31Y TaxID=1115632 RepID=UPI0004673514|nr:nuclear transport factor 2 family protein [Arthrobacter sp. 31Y]